MASGCRVVLVNNMCGKWRHRGKSAWGTKKRPCGWEADTGIPLNIPHHEKMGWDVFVIRLVFMARHHAERRKRLMQRRSLQKMR